MLRTIVIVDDNPADAKILRLALSRRDPAIQTTVLEDGAQAVEYFSRDAAERPHCDLILLDLNLPRVSGFDVLEFLKADAALKPIPVVIVSGSSSRQDIERSYAGGANSYICKPTGIDEVFQMVDRLIAYWFEQVHLPGTVTAAVR